MRIDLPCCGFKNCRHNFDGNCTKPSKQEKCEYWYLLHEELYKPETERKKGHWIAGRDVCWMCSECGKWLNVLPGDVDMNFCPNCGSFNGGE